MFKQYKLIGLLVLIMSCSDSKVKKEDIIQTDAIVTV